jgi:hypothetical protein
MQTFSLEEGGFDSNGALFFSDHVLRVNQTLDGLSATAWLGQSSTIRGLIF